MGKLILGRLLPHRFGPGPLQRTFFERAVPPEQHVSIARFGLKWKPSKIPFELVSTLNFHRNKLGPCQNRRRAVFFHSFRKMRGAPFSFEKAPHQRKNALNNEEIDRGCRVASWTLFCLRPHGTPFHRPSSSIYSTAYRTRGSNVIVNNHDVRNKTGSGQD
jgi:hypothetical protein